MMDELSRTIAELNKAKAQWAKDNPTPAPTENTDATIKRKQRAAPKIIKDDKIYHKILDRQHNKITNIKELIRLPKKDEQIRIITQKSFNAFAILRYLLQFGDIE